MTTVDLSSPFGAWLRRLRSQQDLTQEALAERANCSVQSIRFFESGKRRPSVAMAEHLATILAVPPEEQADFVHAARAPLAGAERKPAAGQPATTRQATPLMLAATHLIGRQSETAILTRLIVEDQHRLVTMTGMGGIGKTRLAIHLAHLLQPHFRDGAAFVSLASLTKVTEVPLAVARELGMPLPAKAALAEQLDELLAGRALLLVLDNFEHLLSEDAQAALVLLSHILEHHPNVQLLVTSRERLRLAGEQTFVLGGLAVPSDACFLDPRASEALMLFAQRASQVAPHFALTEENCAAVAEICGLLEGAPLAIELAAAWSQLLTPNEVLAELTRSLDILSRGDRNAPERHRSLRDLFRHSLQLLDAESQHALMRLALFRGGFTRAGAQAVAGVDLPLLAELADKSLLRVFMQQRPSGETVPRYYIHNLLRTYLQEQLAHEDALHQTHLRHAAYYADLADRLEPQLYGSASAATVQALNEELANFRLMLEWSLLEEGAPALGLRLAGALGRYWYLAGHWREGCDWLQKALLHAESEPAHRARALTKWGELLHMCEEYPTAAAALRDGLALWQTLHVPQQTAWALFQLGVVTSSQGDHGEAERQLAASLAVYRQLGDAWSIATVLNQLAGVAISRGDYVAARHRLDEALPLTQRTATQGIGMAVSLNLLGRVLLGQEDAAGALHYFDAAMAIVTERNHQEGRAWSLLNIGLARLALADLAQAKAAFQAALELNREMGRNGGVTANLEGLAAVAVAEGETCRARELLDEAERLRPVGDRGASAYEVALHARTLHALASVRTPAYAAAG